MWPHRTQHSWDHWTVTNAVSLRHHGLMRTVGAPWGAIESLDLREAEAQVPGLFKPTGSDEWCLVMLVKEGLIVTNNIYIIMNHINHINHYQPIRQDINHHCDFRANSNLSSSFLQWLAWLETLFPHRGPMKRPRRISLSGAARVLLRSS